MKDLLRAVVRAAEQSPLSPLTISSLATDLGYSLDLARMAELIVLSDGWLTRDERGYLIPSRKLIRYRQRGWDADLDEWRAELRAYQGKKPLPPPTRITHGTIIRPERPDRTQTHENRTADTIDFEFTLEDREDYN